MENESPNLFDSEPVSVKLTVAENPDDVLEEKHENIGNASVDEDAEEDGDSEQRSVVEYRTDDEDEDDVNESADVDRSAERQEDGTASKATAVHKGLPPGRVKLIMKMDPDVNIVAGEAVFLLTKATESFVGLLAQHCHKAMVASNKKTLQKKHIDAVIEDNVPFEFLEGALDW